MKKLISVCTAILFVLTAVVAVSAAAKVDGRKTCEAYIADVTLDGKIDDAWNYAPKYEVTGVKTFEKNSYYKEGMKTGVDFASEYCKVLWNGKDTLYVLAVVVDKTPFLTAEEGKSWNNDSVEIFWSFANSKTDTKAEKVQTRIQSDGTIILNKDKFKDCKVAKTSDGFIVEAAIDVSKVGGAGQYLGIDFQYNDSVLGKTRQVCLGWSDPNDKASSDPTVYGQCLLSSTKVADLKAAEAAKTTKAAATTAVAAKTTAAAKTADASVVIAAVALTAAAAIIIKKKH